MAPALGVIGSIVIDILVQTPRLPTSGENIHVPSIQVTPGGKAANAAVAFARLGASSRGSARGASSRGSARGASSRGSARGASSRGSARGASSRGSARGGRAHLIGNTGADFFADYALATLAAEGVDTAGVSRDAEAETGAGVLLVGPTRDTAFLIAPGANQTLKPAQLEASLRPLLPHLDGLLFNFESPEDCLLLAVELTRPFGIPIFVDAGPYRPYSPALWRHATILSPNEHETAALVGHTIDDDASAIAAARTLLAQGPQAVVLKLGERGALLATASGVEFVPAFPIQPVDTAGAGDAFSAGLAWALLQGQTLPLAVRFANACGAVAASRFGTLPTMPSRAEVEALAAA